MKLQITPTKDGQVQDQFTTFRNPNTGKPAELSPQDAQYWAKRAIEVSQHFCSGSEDVTVKIVKGE